MSSFKGYKDTVETLLEHDANVNNKTKTGATSLSLACKNNHIDVVKLLLQKNASPDEIVDVSNSILFNL